MATRPPLQTNRKSIGRDRKAMSQRKPVFFTDVYIQEDVAKFSVCGVEFTIDAEDLMFLENRSWHLLTHKERLRTYLRGWDSSKKKKVLFHREIMKAEQGVQVDHINGNSLDNRKSNLRVCSHAENIWNRSAHSNNTSGYKGVSKSDNKWKACIKKHGKFYYLGVFDTPQEASEAYNSASKQLHEKFSHPSILGESEVQV